MQSPYSELGTSVREALPSDAPRVTALAGQLGYEVPLAHVERQIARMNAQRTILVAVVPRVGVVGWISVALCESVTESGRADVQGLVVEDEYRSNGIGRMLLAAAESWARGRGCASIRLLSNVLRERAHAFYERLGYQVLKTQHAFKKSL